jgi:uncharacterized protein YndB with AHSA1/START domain
VTLPVPADDDPRTIRVDEFLPHPPAKVWRALTDSALIARWLMPNDFKLEIGHRFRFQAQPIPQAGFGGTGHSEVLDFEPERMLKISWCAAPEDESDLDSTVTFTLEPEGTGTRLFLVHDGFDPDDPYQAVSRRFMGGGWPGVARAIGRVIEESGAVTNP